MRSPLLGRHPFLFSDYVPSIQLSSLATLSCSEVAQDLKVNPQKNGPSRSITRVTIYSAPELTPNPPQPFNAVESFT